jgi:hypothetical protein
LSTPLCERAELNELHIDHPGLLGNPNLKSEHVSSIDLQVTYAASGTPRTRHFIY